MANRLYAQYRDKGNAKKLSDIPVAFKEQILSVVDYVNSSWIIDDNYGEALNVIGRIVDIDRNIVITSYLTVYQCNADGDFECGDDEIQLSETSIANDSDLSDEYFRYLLKAKIAKNNSDATIDSILTAVNFVLPNAVATKLIDNEDMTFSIEISGTLSNIEIDLVNNGGIIPVPQGVTFTGFVES